LWGEATKIGDQLFWCDGNATVAVPVAVRGNTDQPFYLVSFPLDTPNLNAVAWDYKFFNLSCLHSPEILKKCENGTRVELTPFERFLREYKVESKLLY